MALEVLPPSPNWYLPCACSYSDDGLFAFATKSSILLLNVNVSPPTFAGSLSGHAERVTSVAFRSSSGEGDTLLCASAGDDGFIKIWSIKNKSVCHEKKCQENKITSLDWSSVNPDIVVAGDEKGCLVYWDLKSSKKDDAKLLRPDKGCIYTLACSPHDSKIVALGYRDGKIFIVDALSKKNPILHHLRGHNDEVQSLVWAPFIGEDAFLKNKPEKGEDDDDQMLEPGCLLASGSRDKTIRMWSTGQGKLLKVMNLPPRGGGGQRPRDRGDEGGGMKSRVWVSLYWPQNKHTQLIASSHGGDMILWDLSKPSQPKWEILGGDVSHQRSVFNISGQPGDQDRVITTSMDRQVICWNLSTLQSEWSLPTQGGFIYSISPSPLDPARLALGVGDQMVRVWNTGSRGRMYDVTTLWQGIKSKVTVVSWHPLRENSLAYGTDDGRVGIFNVAVLNKPPQQFWTYHKKTIYSLCWGPPCPKPDGSHSQSHHVYSCGGEGIVYQHNPAKLEQERFNINSLIKQTNNYQHLLPQRSDVAWRLDGRAVAIGNEDGSIEIFAPPDLQNLCIIHVQSKIINCLSWYPDFAETVQSKFESIQSEVLDSEPKEPVDSREQTSSEEGQDGHHGEEHHIQDEDQSCSVLGSSFSVTAESKSKNNTESLSKGMAESSSDQVSHGAAVSSIDAENSGAFLSENIDDGLSRKTVAVEVKQQPETGEGPQRNTGQGSSDSPSDQTSEETGITLSDVNGLRAPKDRHEGRYWLASGSNDYEVEIYDLESVLGTKGEPMTVPMTSSCRSLAGHTGRVTNLAWSPHGDGRLVSTSYDNSAQVWDVLKGEPVANFRGHMGRVFSCVWSCSDPDVIITGSEDFCVMKWHVSKVTHIKPPKTGGRKPVKRGGKKNKKSSKPQSNDNKEGPVNGEDVVMATVSASVVHKDQKQADITVTSTGMAPSTDQTREDGNGVIEDAKQLLERKKRELLAQVEEIEGRIDREMELKVEDDEEELAIQADAEASEEISTRERSDALVAILDRLAPKEEKVEKDQEKGTSFKDMTAPGSKRAKHKRYKSLFPTSSSQDNRGKSFLQQDCIDLTRLKQGQISDEISDPAPLHLGMFVDRKMTLKMLNDEALQHGEINNYDQRSQLCLWKGNILQPLREAIKKGQLTDWLVAMAPLAGHDVWLQTCDAYAQQLESQDQIHRAVSFYLISHQVYKALALLKKNGMFRDAITLAQVRLLPSDPVLLDLYLTWANHLESNNSYEPAARCYLALNQPMNAIKLLARKGNPAALGTALHVANLSDLTEEGLVVSIATRLLNVSLVTGQWKQAFEIFSLDKTYQVHASLVLMYELLVWCLIHEGYLTPNHDVSYTHIHDEIASNIQWSKPNDGDCMWSIPTLNGDPLIDAVLARASISCDQSPDMHVLMHSVIPYDLMHDINKVLRYVAGEILLGQSSGQSEVMMGHVAEAVKLCHTSGHPAIAISILQITALQVKEPVMTIIGKLSPRNQGDAIPRLVSLRAQYRLTQLYHARKQMDSALCGSPELDKRLQSVKEAGGGMSRGQDDDHQDGEDAKKHEDEDDGVILNPRTEGYLFKCDTLKDTSWPLCLGHPAETQDKQPECSLMPSDSSTETSQTLMTDQMVERILNEISGTRTLPSLIVNGGYDGFVNGTAVEKSHQEADSRKLTESSQTLLANGSKKDTVSDRPSSGDTSTASDEPSQSPSTAEQYKQSTVGSIPHSQTLDGSTTHSTLHNSLDLSVMMTSIKTALLEEHPVVLNVVFNIVLKKVIQTFPNRKLGRESREESLKDAMREPEAGGKFPKDRTMIEVREEVEEDKD